jgi:chaperonin GroES
MNNVNPASPVAAAGEIPRKHPKDEQPFIGSSSPATGFFWPDSSLAALTRPAGTPKYRARCWHSSRMSAATPKNFNKFNLLGKRIPMKFRPLGDRVVVRRIKEDQKTAGGIIIPDTVAEKPQEGEVVSVGPGALDDQGKRVTPEVKAGDYVLFGKWSGTEVKVDGEELLIMKESDIMGILEGKKAKK